MGNSLLAYQNEERNGVFKASFVLDIELDIVLEVCIYYKLLFKLSFGEVSSSSVRSSLSGVAWNSQIVECRKFEAIEKTLTWSFLSKNRIFEP